MSTFDFYVGLDGYRDALREVDSLVNIDSRFPARPFRSDDGVVSVVEFSRVLGRDFGSVLGALAERFGDERVFLVATSPDPTRYIAIFDTAPAFQVGADALPDGFGDGLIWEPPGEISGALAYTVDEFAIVGTSKKWAIWAQRDWEIAAVHTPTEGGEWEDLAVPFFEKGSDIASTRSPVGWGMVLSEADIDEFWQSM